MMPNDVAANARGPAWLCGDGPVATPEEREAWRTAGAVREAEWAIRQRVLRALIEALKVEAPRAEEAVRLSTSQQDCIHIGFAAAFGTLDRAVRAALKEEGHE